MNRRTWIPLAGLALLLTACPAPDPEPPADPDAEAPSPQDRFWAGLEELCGEAYRGEQTEGPAGDTTFVGRDLVMHVRACTEDEIRIPFHVGDDRSRTWVLFRTDEGLRLKHDHRHDDGTEEELTWYGGDTVDEGTATRQEFPADEETAEMLPVAATNVWTVEIHPGDRFVYALRREGTDRRFRIEFDVTEEVEAPPPPWGFEDEEVTEEPEGE